MRVKLVIGLLLFMFVQGCSAYDNDSMTDPYKKMIQDKEPLNAVLLSYTETMGDWFYLMLIGAPYIMLWLHQRSVHIPTIWLTVCLASYGTLIFGLDADATTTTYPVHIFYGMAVIWVMTVVVKVFSPLYKK